GAHTAVSHWFSGAACPLPRSVCSLPAVNCKPEIQTVAILNIGTYRAQCFSILSPMHCVRSVSTSRRRLPPSNDRTKRGNDANHVRRHARYARRCETSPGASQGLHRGGLSTS